MVNEIAIYTPFMVYRDVSHRQRYWKWVYHRTGPKAGEKWYKRRVWKTVSQRRAVPGKGRFELHGTGRELQKAIIRIKHGPRVPKGYVRVSARELLEHEEKYSEEGYWTDFEVESI